MEKTASQVAAEIDAIQRQNSNAMAVLGGPTADMPEPENAIAAIYGPQSSPEKNLALAEVQKRKNILAAAPRLFESFKLASEDARPFTGKTKTSPSAFNPFGDTAGQAAFKAALGPTIITQEGANRQALVKSLEDKFTPAFGDSDERVRQRYLSLIDYLKSNPSSPTTANKKIDLDKYPSTNLERIGVDPKFGGGMFPEKAPPKEPVEMERRFLNGRWYIGPKQK